MRCVRPVQVGSHSTSTDVAAAVRTRPPRRREFYTKTAPDGRVAASYAVNITTDWSARSASLIRIPGTMRGDAEKRPSLSRVPHQGPGLLAPVYAVQYSCTTTALGSRFYAPQLYRQVLLRRVLAMGILSVCLSRPGGIPSPDEIETPGLHHVIARSL